MTFQSTVMTVAIIFLIVSLCFIGLALYNQKYKSEFPPVIPNCPDYWDMSGNMCISHPKVGDRVSSCTAPMDFTLPTWAGAGGKCAKYRWAKQCNLTWDGITNIADTCT
jgi:hypothetical protein